MPLSCNEIPFVSLATHFNLLLRLMTTTAIWIPNKTRAIEISAVFITGAGKFIFMDWLNLRLPFILIAIIGWSGYVFFRQRQVRGIMEYWGFRSDNFMQALKIVLPFGMVAVMIFFATGWFLGTINLSWHIIPILIVYPMWGIIQQFLVISLVAGNMRDIKAARLPDPIIALITASLFGALHYPFYWLILGTSVLALFYCYVFFKVRNVYVMGIFHGWLGAFFFYTVVGRDPFIEVFGNLKVILS